MSTSHAATKTVQLARWISTTNHKDIGTLYFWASMVFFIVGGFMEQAVAEPRGGEEVWKNAGCSGCHNAYPSAPKTRDDWQKIYNEAPANMALEDAEKTRLFHLGNNAWMGGLLNKGMPQRGLLPDTDIAHVEFYRAICWNLINLSVSIDEGDCPVDSLDDFKKPAFRTESQSE